MGLFGNALVSAGGEIAGSVVGGLFSASQAGKSRHWQEKMYNQRYQRTMADLKAAGLNPMLAMGGSPGNAPAGAMGSMPDMDLGTAINSGVHTGIAAKAAKVSLEAAKTQLEASRIGTGLQSDMVSWLRENSHYRDLFLAGLAAKTAGLSPSIFGPLMMSQSKGFGALGRKLGDMLFQRLDAGRPNDGTMDDIIRRSLQKK